MVTRDEPKKESKVAKKLKVEYCDECRRRKNGDRCLHCNPRICAVCKKDGFEYSVETVRVILCDECKEGILVWSGLMKEFAQGVVTAEEVATKLASEEHVARKKRSHGPHIPSFGGHRDY